MAEADVLKDDVDEVAEHVEKQEETDAEKEKREKEELEARLKEYGGATSFRNLVSYGTGFEKFMLCVGMVGAAGNGFGQIAIQWFFGGSMDSLGSSVVPQRTLDYCDENNLYGVAPCIREGPDGLNAQLDLAHVHLIDEMNNVAYQMYVFALFIGFSSFFFNFSFRWFADKSAQRIRSKYFEALLHRDISWFDTHDPAALSTEMNDELETYKDGMGTKFALVFQGVSMLFGGFVIAFFKSWRLALVLLSSMPFMMIGMIVMGKASQEILEEKMGAYSSAASVMDECLYAIRTVVTFGGERKELQRYEDAIEGVRKTGVINRVKMGAGMGWFMGMGMMGSMALAFWVQSEGLDPDVSGGDVMVVFGSVLMGSFSVGSMMPGLMRNAQARQAMARFFHITENESEIQKMGEDRREDLGGPVQTFELKDVHFSYPARPDCPILNGVSLQIKQGQKVAFVGESGSGKSTIMALLERFYDPTQGTVLINGKDLRALSIRSVRRSIGYVGQEPVLFATTVGENIKMTCPSASDQDVKRVIKMAEMDFVDRLPMGLNSYVGSGGSQFSGGQKQRIAIARALLTKPTALFLDEATSALDSKSERAIQETIDGVAKAADSTGMTIVSIAHRLSTIQNSDVIFVLRMGQVVESGTHADLMQREAGVYQALAAAQKMSLDGEQEKGEASELPTQTSKSKTGALTKELSKNLSKQISNDANAKEKEREAELLKSFNTKSALRRLLTFVKREQWQIPLGCLCAMAGGLTMPLMGGFVMMRAMVGMFANDGDQIREACILFLVLGAVKFCGMIMQFGLFGNIGEWMTKRARMGIITSIMSQEIGFHDDPEHTPGQLSGLMTLSSSRVARLLISIGDTSDAISTLLGGLIVAFFLCWEFSIALLLGMPLMSVVNMMEMKNQMAIAEGMSESVKNSAQLLQDALTNAKTVYACGNENELVKLYDKIMISNYKDTNKNAIIGGICGALGQAFIFAFMAACFQIMGHIIVGVDLGFTYVESEFEDVFGAFMALIYGFMGIGMAFALTGDVGQAKVAAHDIFAIMDRPSQINGLNPVGNDYDDLPEIGRFQFEDVRFHYPFRKDVQVLKGMSFTIEAGTSVGVVGPSGGGKSTIMAMIQRFYDPQGGQVYVGAAGSKVALTSANIRWWRGQIGFVGQEPVLFKGSVLENVKYGLQADVSDEHLERCKQDAFLTFLDNKTSHGWKTEVGVRGGRLSGGQKQRVAICRALMRNPKVILLDEATSALDSQSEKVVIRALERARIGRTSFAIAHRLSTIQDCDVIIVVSDGKIVEQGPHAELMAKEGVYFKLQESQGGVNAESGSPLESIVYKIDPNEAHI